MRGAPECIRVFVHYAMRVRELIASLLLLILLGAFLVGRLQGIDLFDAVYFAFLTALSVGYGDIHPSTVMGKTVSVAIGLVGILLVGITVAIATRALADTANGRQQSTR